MAETSSGSSLTSWIFPHYDIIRLKKSLLFTAACLLSCSEVAECALPDAGSILREQTPRRESLDRPQHQLSESADKDERFEPTFTLMVKAFRFSGYDGLVTEPELQRLVSGSVGRSLNSVQLQELVEQVSALLKKRGWLLARAYFPEQDLSSGVVTIAILRGEVERVAMIESDPSRRLRKCVVQRYANAGVRAGEALSQDRLERSVLLLNDLPGMSVKAVISPGSRSGTSIVRYLVSEKFSVSAIGWVDNNGNRYTGTGRANALISLNDPLRIGDQLTLTGTLSGGLNQARLEYRVPVGFSGLKAKVAMTGMDYELQEEFSSLRYRGESSIIEAGLSYPIRRSRLSTITVGASCSGKTLKDRQNGSVLHDKRVKSGSFSVEGLMFDDLLGGGSTNWSVSVTSGNFHESNSLAYADAVDNGTEGGYTVLNTTLNRVQRISDRTNLNLAWNAQFADGNLNSSEQFYLGGPNGVRAFPVGEGGGDEGQLLNVDLRYRLPLSPDWGKVELGGFYDAGCITLNKHRFAGDVSTATGRNFYWLQGAGVGLNWVYRASYVVRCSWAHAIGDNSGRSTDGTNSDGKADNSRFWLQGIVYF